MKILISICLLISAGLTSYALEDWKGRVTDMRGEPVAYANVVLLSKTDSTVVSGAVTDESGAYSLHTDEDGILMVSMLGYETVYLTPSEDMDVVLKEDSAMLDGAVSTGMMVKTRVTATSMVTEIQGTVLGNSGSVMEMLSKVPGMMANGDELEVLGKGSPVIYINGRKLHDMNELKHMRSEDVQNVEVINNPGAQYDATVSAVVRIKTLRHEGEGFGFDLNAANNQDLQNGVNDPSTTLNLRYRFRDFDLFGSVNYWKWDQISTYYDHVKMFTDKSNYIVEDCVANDHFYSSGLDYNLGFNWQLSDNHSVGARFVMRETVDAGTYYSSITDIIRYDESSGQVSSVNESLQDEKRHSPYDWEGNVYYSGMVGRLGINFNADYLSNRKDMFCNISDVIDTEGYKEGFQEGVTTSRLAAAKLVLTYPVWKGQLEAGAEATSVERGSSYSITNYPLPASDSKVNENNVSAFVSYGFGLPKFGSVSVGLRYEHVGFNYTDLLDGTNSMGRYQDEFFPSLSWAGQFGPVHASLSYSLRTSRPGYDDLSDRIKYINSFTLLQGDPKLKNERKQEVGMNARYRWMTLSVSYERLDDALTQMFNIYGEDNMLLVKRSNIPQPVRNLLVFLSANPTWGVYSPGWSAGMQKPWTDIEFDDPRTESGKVMVSYSRPMFFFTLNNAFRFKRSWQLEANMNIRTKGDNLNFRMTSNAYNLGFAVQKCWLKNDALCMRISLQDVLKRSLQDTYSNAGFLIHTETPIRNDHRLDISLRYTFNASKSRYKGTGAGKDAQSRM